MRVITINHNTHLIIIKPYPKKPSTESSPTDSINSECNIPAYYNDAQNINAPLLHMPSLSSRQAIKREHNDKKKCAHHCFVGGQAFVHHPWFSVNLYYELVAEGTPQLEQIAHAHFFSIHTYRFSSKTINKECNQKLHTWHGHMTQSHGKKVVTEAHTVHGGLQKKYSCIALVLTQIDDTTQRPCISTDWYCIFTRITRTKIEESTKPSYDDFRHPVTCWKSSAGYMQISVCKVVTLQYRGDFLFCFFSVCSGCRLYGGRGLIHEKIQQSNFVRHPQLAGRNSTTERPHLLKHGIRNSSLKTTWELGGVKQQI